MTRTLKLLGLVALAVVAVSAVSAAGAQGAVQKIHCTTKPCKITGESAAGILKLTPSGLTIKCTAKYESTLTEETVTEATVKAEYTKCKAAGVAATVDMNSCDFKFTSTGEAEATAKVDINCTTAGDEITITAPALPCTVHIAPQNNLEHVVFTNEGTTEPTDITAHATVTLPVKATEAGCEGNTEGHLEDTVTLKGFKDEAGVEGAQVGLHVF